MARKYRIGVVGFGRMGRGFVAAMLENPVWEVAAICDVDPLSRSEAKQIVPTAKIADEPEAIFTDESLEVVGLFTLADSRPAMIRRALAENKHIIAEKPIAADIKTEWELVKEIEASDRLVAVNLFNRNAWYHKEIQQYIADGVIGELGIIRVCHMTPGHLPTEGHEPEGPPFHDCGMHYVDVARWYARSEYKTWHAQGIRMWNYKDPWWVQCHGTFENGVVFDITQGFVYGHLAKEKTHNCYVDCIGTKGIARMRHNFKDAMIEVHGIDATLTKTAAFNDKKLDVMVDLFARSLIAGKNVGFPTVRDSAVASQVSWHMLDDAVKNTPPSVGTLSDLSEILEHRKHLRTGFGLPLRRSDQSLASLGQLSQSQACGEEFCQVAPSTKSRKLGT
ncbi:MAG: Gfo/Idh/MocA family oxidoreductase [Phycisphaerales bacterium]|nr:Gfo/Idh/MocA family oxidoreductase [Phycisphaerales bacterium]